MNAIARRFRLLPLGLLILSLSACDPIGLAIRQGKDAAPQSEPTAPTAPTSPPPLPEAPIPAGRFEVRLLTPDWCIHSRAVPALLVQLRGAFPTVRFREYDSESPKNAKLMARYDPDGFPFFVILDGGRVIDREAGLPDLDEYAPYLKAKIAAALAGR